MKSTPELQQWIETSLKNLELPAEPAGLYDPISYFLTLGGKRMRPTLLLLGNQLFGGDLSQAIGPAQAIEVFHNFTLVHDDIMDEAPLRRGKATVHTKWDENTGILSGDAMLVKAYQLLAECPTAHLPAVLTIFNEVALEVCEGQQYDMDFETRNDVTIDEYVNMIRLKTAVLLGASLKIGAVIAGASAADAKLVYDFGVNIGVAFQLQDDILDVYAEQEKFGKQVGGDILANKKTFLLLKAEEKSNSEQHALLSAMLKNEFVNAEEKVRNVISIYDAVGVRQEAEAEMQRFYQKGLDCLNAISVDPAAKAQLLQLADMLMVRES